MYKLCRVEGGISYAGISYTCIKIVNYTFTLIDLFLIFFIENVTQLCYFPNFFLIHEQLFFFCFHLKSKCNILLILQIELFIALYIIKYIPLI